MPNPGYPTGVAYSPSRPAPTPTMFDLVLRILAGVWVELTLTGLLLAPAVLLGVLVHPLAGIALVLVVVVVVLTVPVLRAGLGRLLYGRIVRRQFDGAVRACVIWTYRDQTPKVRRLERVPAGEVLHVAVPVGGTITNLQDSAETLAAALQVREVRIERDPDNARRGAVALVRRDPLTQPAPPWPQLDAGPLSLWAPVPVGVDDTGRQVALSLPERNVLLGGEPGAGKSAALSLLVATAALDPDVRLHLFDGKLVELACWAGIADHAVGPDTEQANLVLRALQAEMETRYLALLANKARKVTPTMGLPLHVLVVDELAHYLLAPDRKVRTEFAELLRDLVARGRAAGLIVLAATQKPAHDVIPTALRDLFGVRWALRCNTPQASDTILGSGWASAGHTASTIDPAHRGVGHLLHEGGTPTRLRCHYLDDVDLAELAARAEVIRQTSREAGPVAVTAVSVASSPPSERTRRLPSQRAFRR